MKPSVRHFAFAFAIILVGLAGRSAIDKLLALAGGAERVAQWAQVQSLVDMVQGAISVGLGQGVTVLVAQQGDRSAQRLIFRSSMMIGGLIGSAVGLVLCFLVANGLAGGVWPHGIHLAVLATAAGASGIAAALINAYWLGGHRQDRVLWLSAALMLPPVLAAGWGASMASIVLAQLLAGLIVTGLVMIWLRRRVDGGKAGGMPGVAAFARPKWRWSKIFVSCSLGHPLWRYVPVGLSIVLASPLSQVLVRGEVSAALSWHDAGIVQAIWRSAEWVTLIMAGALSLVYLPRFSRVAGRSAELARQMGGAAWRVLGVSGVLLLLLWLNQHRVLAMLYESRVVVSDSTIGLFLLGDWLRVASWIILFGLLALRATWWVTIGEFFSLPLFAGLVMAFSDGMSLERAGWLYLLTYAVYLLFNLIGMRVAWRGVLYPPVISASS